MSAESFNACEYLVHRQVQAGLGGHLAVTGPAGSLTYAGQAAGPAAAYGTWFDSPAFWLYTSGTTGRPKAAMHRHGSVARVCETYARRSPTMSRATCWYAATPSPPATGAAPPPPGRCSRAGGCAPVTPAPGRRTAFTPAWAGPTT